MGEGMDEWIDIPEYMRVLTPEELKEKRVELFGKEFGDKLADAKRRARSFRHLQIAYRETDGNHLLGKGIPEWHIICEKDGDSIVRLYSGGQPFNFDIVWLETALIRHFHLKHPQIVGDRTEDERGENQAMDHPGSGLLRDRYDRPLS